MAQISHRHDIMFPIFSRVVFCVLLLSFFRTIYATTDLYLKPDQICQYFDKMGNTLGRSSQDSHKYSIRRHFNDSYKPLINPIYMSDPLFYGSRNIFGTIRYLGILHFPYRYRVTVEKEQITILVKIHINANKKRIKQANLTSKIKSAEEIWNSHQNKINTFHTPIVFKFELTDIKKQSDFSVNLRAGSSGPYNIEWSPTWGPYVVAHEIGHMLGLSDEYNNLTRNGSKCEYGSIMCNPSSEPMPYHYYFILRRIFDHE